VFFGRSAWNLVYGYAAAQGLSFASTFRLGTSLGLSSYRRAIMLGDYNIFKGVLPSKSWFSNAPKTQRTEAWMLAPGYVDQRSMYKYTVKVTGNSVFTNLPREGYGTIWSDTPMTLKEIEDEAMNMYGGLNRVESWGIDVEEVTVSHGYLRQA